MRRCTPPNGACVAATLEDCHDSTLCADAGLCYLNGEKKICDDGSMNANQPVFVGGIVMVGVGGATVVVGAIYAFMGAVLCGFYASPGETCVPVFGLSLMGAGAAVSLGVALPMMVVGGKDVPREPTGVPTVRLGPTGGSLHWSF